MIWRNPWAWLGLLTLAVPVLVHLLARTRSPRRPFPTLRFLEATPPLASRRSRLSDLLLLVIRMAILAIAISALAQPFFPTADREARDARALSVAVVVDTSWSMARLTPEGERAVDVARRIAEEARDDADVHAVIETAVPGETLAGAVSWLEGRPGSREIRVISDFQVSALDSVDLAEVPPGVGLDLRRIEVDGAGDVASRIVEHGRSVTEIRVAAGIDGTDARWIRGPEGEPAEDGLLLLHAPGEASTVAAVRRALEQEGTLVVDPARPVVVVYPGYEDEERILAMAVAPDTPWIGDAIHRLVKDERLARAGVDLGAAQGIEEDWIPGWVPVATTPDGTPLVRVAQVELDGPAGLLVSARFDPGTFASASLLVALGRATDPSPAAGELDPEVLTDDRLARWSRAGIPTPATSPRDGPGDSDGRWFWLLVLIALLVEGVVRRRMHARAA